MLHSVFILTNIFGSINQPRFPHLLPKALGIIDALLDVVVDPFAFEKSTLP